MTITIVTASSTNANIGAAAGDIAGSQYYYQGLVTPNATFTPTGGNDTVTTGSGNDTVFFGMNNGKDIINLGSGNDSVIGAGEAGPISGGSQDTVNAGTGNSVIDFQSGGYVVYNGDSISGSTGIDYVYAYGDVLGHDTFTAGINNDTIIGSQAGNDKVVIGTNYHGNYYIDASGTITDGGTGNDLITTGAGDPLVSNSTISGGSGHDQIITYGHTDNIITTNSGNDTINTMAANDTITSGGGNNLIYDGTGGSEAIHFHGGINTVSYVYANTTVSLNLSSASAASATIGLNHDTISYSGITSPQLFALSEAHNDHLTGNSNASYIISTGTGNDILNMSGLTGADTIYGNSGKDTINFSATTHNITLNLATGNSLNGDAQSFIGFSGNESIVGGSGNDNITANGGNDTIIGGSGSDTITGGSGNDSVIGGTAGGNVFYAGTGNDMLVADNTTNGNIFYGNSGSGTMVGSNGNDQFFLNNTTGNYTISPGSDLLQTITPVAGGGESSWSGGKTIWGGSGNFTLVMNASSLGENNGPVGYSITNANGGLDNTAPSSFHSGDIIEFAGPGFNQNQLFLSQPNGSAGTLIEPYRYGIADVHHDVFVYGMSPDMFTQADFKWIA